VKATLLNEGDERTFALVFDVGDETMAGLTAFADEHRVGAAQFTAIGAFSGAVLGFFDWETKEYRRIPVKEQVEVLSLIGDIALDNGQPKVHAHVVVGLADGTTRGGHLMTGHVRPTLEVILVESPQRLQRVYDPNSGLALIRV